MHHRTGPDDQRYQLADRTPKTAQERLAMYDALSLLEGQNARALPSAHTKTAELRPIYIARVLVQDDYSGAFHPDRELLNREGYNISVQAYYLDRKPKQHVRLNGHAVLRPGEEAYNERAAEAE